MRPRISWEPGSQVPRENPALAPTLVEKGKKEEAREVKPVKIKLSKQLETIIFAAGSVVRCKLSIEDDSC